MLLVEHTKHEEQCRCIWFDLPIGKQQQCIPSYDLQQASLLLMIGAHCSPVRHLLWLYTALIWLITELVCRLEGFVWPIRAFVVCVCAVLQSQLATDTCHLAVQLLLTASFAIRLEAHIRFDCTTAISDLCTVVSKHFLTSSALAVG